CQQYSSRPPTF
nr:immunoglobulin light chain junction region [Macaca mulatta]MPN92472.1 immunoglobulin light chain junction region [Macaca mulatta]MPN94050.1 immunoglobulin light chain junction region [Macaca mulatta]MPN96686.1 immunoglobulin light chain junction region [Macaca mulatta]MPN96761.1 immunoglobulin light chain junction region [Macaca mulatta]